MFSGMYSSQWRGFLDPSSWMASMPASSGPSQFSIPSSPRSSSYISGQPRFHGGFRPPPPSQLFAQAGPSQFHSQPPFAGIVDGYGNYGVPSSSGFYGSSVTPQVYPQQVSTAFCASDSAHASVYNRDSYPTFLSQPWYFDSGATNHITHSMQNLNLDQSHSKAVNEGIMVGNGNTLHVTHTGKGLLPTPHATFHLSHILHTPHIYSQSFVSSSICQRQSLLTYI